MIERTSPFSLQGYLFYLYFFSKGPVCPWAISYLIIEVLCFSFKTWSKEICSLKLEEKLSDYQKLCPLHLDTT